MKIGLLAVQIAFCTIMGSSMAQAANLYVRNNGGSDANAGNSWSAALATIQAALDAAINGNGDIIHVAAGTYVEHVTIGKNSVTLLGSYPAEGGDANSRDRDTHPSIVDGSNTGIAIDIAAASNVTIDGFVVQNGNNTNCQASGIGGGVSIHYVNPNPPVTLNNNLIQGNTACWGGGVGVLDSAVTLTGNLIRNNTSSRSGGGVSLGSGTTAILERNTLTGNTSNEAGGGLAAGNVSLLTLRRNIIQENQFHNGGGIALQYCLGLLDAADNSIISNQAAYDGGGIYYFTCLGGRMVRNKIQHNTAGNWGGGICIFSSRPEALINNLITDNTANRNGGGVSLYDGSTALMVNNTLARNHAGSEGGGLLVWNNNNSIDVTNSIFWENSEGLGSNQIKNYGTANITYSDVQDGWPGTGNINDPPSSCRRTTTTLLPYRPP